MSTFKEIQAEKQIDLDNAYKMALSLHVSQPQINWVIRTIAWMYYDYLKIYVKKYDVKTSIKILKKISELGINESRLNDNIAYQVGKLIFHIKNKNTNWKQVGVIFDLIKGLTFSKKTKSYSYILKSFSKKSHKWNRYIEFIEWWGLNNFSEQDKVGGVNHDLSIIEKTHIAYLDALCDDKHDNSAKVLSILKSITFDFVPYYNAKMLLSNGSADILTDFFPYIINHTTDYKNWVLLADIHNNIEVKKVCLYKALSLHNKQKIRTKLINILVGNSDYSEVSDLLNNRITGKYIDTADELLQSCISTDTIIINHIDKDVVYFASPTKHGYFKCNEITFSVGTIVEVKLTHNGNAFYTLHSLDVSLNQYNVDLKKTINENKVYIQYGRLGFINDGFYNNTIIQSNILFKHNIQDHQLISGTAMLHYNTRRSTYNWIVYDITEVKNEEIPF